MYPSDRNFRKYFKIDEHIAYLNTASSGIMTVKASESANTFLNTAMSRGDVLYEEYTSIIDSARNAAGLLLDVPEGNIGFIHNTTHGIEIIKRTFPDYRNIIIIGKSFPCTKAPFMYDSKYRVEMIADDMNLLEKALTRKKKALVFVDYINFLSGEMRDIEIIAEICRKYKAILGIDAIQAMGWLPIDMQRIKPDFLFAGASKWLLGPQGIGILYADSSHQSALAAMNSGWLSLKYDNFESFGILPHPRGDISVVESGTRNLLGLIILKENLKILNQCSLKRIKQHNLSLTKMLALQLEKMGDVSQDSAHIHSPIIALQRRNGKYLYNYLSDNDTVVSYRDESIRFSVHLYNTKDDIERVIMRLKAYK